jgi:ribonuclease PH
MKFIRRSGRTFDEMRKVEFDVNYLPHAEGSCLAKFGNTHVLCTATVDLQVPPFLRDKGTGWITAEYGMLPRSTGVRYQRESLKGKVDGRTQEIQRLIGRSLRAAVDLKSLGERQIIVDCDVIRADGGTRTAAITGGFLALHQAIKKLRREGVIRTDPIVTQVAAISCGIVSGHPLLDLEYVEDSQADVDANFIMSNDSLLIEVQATGEKRPFSEEEHNQLFSLAKKGVAELLIMQRQIIEKNA